jgi:hypothetical protein
VLTLVARVATIAMEMPIAMAMLEILCLSQVAQSAELAQCHDRCGWNLGNAWQDADRDLGVGADLDRMVIR